MSISRKQSFDKNIKGSKKRPGIEATIYIYNGVVTVTMDGSHRSYIGQKATIDENFLSIDGKKITESDDRRMLRRNVYDKHATYHLEQKPGILASILVS